MEGLAIIPNLDVKYEISIKLRTAGYHSINGKLKQGKVLLNPAQFQMCQIKGEEIHSNPELFEDMVQEMIWTILLERVCLERANNHIRMKDRCKPVCKMARITDLIYTNL